MGRGELSCPVDILFETEMKSSFPTDLCFLPSAMNNQIYVKFELKQMT